MESRTKKKVLLIDDDTSLLVTLSDFLRFEGYEITTAESGEQGLKKLEQLLPDLIILDMSMPGMGGIGFLKEITLPNGKPKYPVLVLTARANMAEFFANVDVDGFIAKPCEPNDLLMEIGRILFLRGSREPAPGTDKLHEKQRVLIGEDDATINEALVHAFAREGYVVDSVAKGPEVVEKAIIGRPAVIVMKLVFENMNGDAVADLLREMENTRSIPIILYDDSGTAVRENRFLMSGGGVKRFVRTSDPFRLVEVVKDVLGG
jgi:CheY-like chemotaxis protein